MPQITLDKEYTTVDGHTVCLSAIQNLPGIGLVFLGTFRRESPGPWGATAWTSNGTEIHGRPSLRLIEVPEAPKPLELSCQVDSDDLLCARILEYRPNFVNIAGENDEQDAITSIFLSTEQAAELIEQLHACINYIREENK